MKNNVFKITLGAMLCACYIVLFLVLNTFFNIADSVIFIFVPVVIALYSYIYGFKYGFICLIVITLISLLILSPINVLFFVLPNLFIGVLYGKLYKSCNNKIIVFSSTILLCFIFDFLATYVFAYLIGMDNLYEVNEIVMLLQNFFSDINEDIIIRLIKNIIPACYIIIALLKTFIIFILCEFILIRLKKKEPVKIKQVSFNKKNGYFYIIVLLMFLCSNFINTTSNIFLIILYNITIIMFILVYLLIFIQCFTFFNIVFLSKNKKNKYYIFSILSILLFPITYLFGILINFLDIKKIILYL